MRNLITRSISGLVYAIIFISAILYSPETYVGLMTFFAAICVFEFSKILKLKNIISYLFLAGFIYLSVQEIPRSINSYLIGASTAGLIILLYLLISIKPIKTENVGQKLFLQIIYLILPFYFLIKLPIIDNNYHPNIIIYIILMIWINDSFAFIVGKNFGKHKLFESVSPKKTIEGFIGGLLFAVLAGVLIGNYSNSFSILNWVIIAIIVAVLGSLGDLVESMLKRSLNIKDSGNLLPGHGGILDRFDGLLLSVPFIYSYLYLIS